ncbi:MAG: hypothetical protein ACOCPZ_00580 [Natrialbaceae archaeon]
MGFQWLSANACPSCSVIPSAADYDEFGYPVCPSCGTIIRSASAVDEPLAAPAGTD